MECTNGLTDRRIEPDLATILDKLTPEIIAALADKHGIAPCGHTPHRKALTAGSDDHGHGRAGTICTALGRTSLDRALRTDTSPITKVAIATPPLTPATIVPPHV